MPADATKHRDSLLKELTIERGANIEKRRRPLWRVLVPICSIAAVAGLYVWLTPAHVEAEPPTPLDEPTSVVATKTVTTPADTSSTLTQPSSSVLDASGYVVARLAATVSSKTTGKVVEVLIEEGMAVKKGQPMAQLDDRDLLAQLDLAEAQANATEAAAAELEAQVRSAQLDYDRALSLVEKKMISQSRLDTLKASLDTFLAQSNSAKKSIEVSRRKVAVHRVALEDLVIRAPFDGVVINKSAQPGEMISPISAGGGFTRTGIGTIVDMDSLEVEVDVSESYIDRVHPGQHVDITLNAYPEHTYQGVVLAVIPTADRSKATIGVRVKFVATDQRVLPEMGVRVAFL